MDKRSDGIPERTKNEIPAIKESSFPYDGIFSPDGFLSTIPCSTTSEDPGDGSLAKVDVKCQGQGQDQLPPTKNLKIETTWKKNGAIVLRNNDLPAAEAAFSIDHILEKILHSLATSDLLKCRFVCQRWCIIARLHLLKQVHLGTTPNSIESLEKIVRASLNTPGSLKLRHITIDSDSFNYWGPEETGFHLELKSRFVAVMNYLLNCSWDTLETFKWENVTFLKGMEWGKFMSKVKAISLDINEGIHDANIFPPGRGLSTIFPKLRSVEIVHVCKVTHFVKFLNRLNPEEEVLNSVRLVRVHNSSDDPAAPVEVSELLRKCFPNADISISGV